MQTSSHHRVKVAKNFRDALLQGMKLYFLTFILIARTVIINYNTCLDQKPNLILCHCNNYLFTQQVGYR
jgi:hypothetical protein